MLRRPWFWILFTLFSAGCALLAFRLFPHASPIVSIDIHMDRAAATQAARKLAAAHDWGPPDSIRDAASFNGDGLAQSFVELEGGGKPALASLIEDDLYSPYAWHVRLFKESETNQTIIRFTPAGQPYGFAETLREQAPGAALSAEAARDIAERSAASAPWNLPLDRFRPAETSQVVRPGNRIDHTFVYERIDRTLGEGRLRLTLVVSGDRLTALDHFIQVPEAFSRRFEQMRSSNNAIATGASVGMALLYLLGGCGFGLAILIRQRAVLWRPPLAWAAVIGLFQLLVGLNAWPLAWLNYDTALSGGAFITRHLVALIANTLVMTFVFFISFAAAESLSRRAFPRHPQLWKLWSRESGPSREVLGQTLGAYLLAPVGILYVAVFYFFASRHLGWWSPSAALVSPDSLAHVFPWLTPFAQAAQAGFWEEMLFRAVPLAGAALLGSRFGGRRIWIAAAFVLQAIVFAGAHANYPNLPAYSRLVELMIPSFIFAALYLRFGLFPAIVLHFVYDVVLMSLPLFATSADGVWLDRSLIVLLALAPLWIVFWRRVQGGAWRDLHADLRNGAWQPAPPPPPSTESPPLLPTAKPMSSTFRAAVISAGLAGLGAWWVATPLQPVSAPLAIDRATAMELARAELDRLEIVLPPGHRVDATVPDRPWEADRFAWQTAGAEAYRALLGTYLPQPRWSVRFATFEGDVAQRAEEWNVIVAGNGEILRVQHKLPEAAAGATLTETDARALVLSTIREKWSLEPATLTEVSATSEKRPSRTDWIFVLKDPAVTTLNPGEARLQVVVAGDEVADAVRFVFAPEEWERLDRARQSTFQIGGLVKSILSAVILIAGIGAAIVAWSRKKFSVRIALFTAATFAFLSLIMAANQWPAVRANFSTAQPLQLQQTMAMIMPWVGVVISSAAMGLLAGLVVQWLRPSPVRPRDAAILGTGLAVAVAGALAAAALLRATAAPPWPSLGLLGTFSPWIPQLIGAAIKVISQSLVLILIFGFVDRFTAGWQCRRAPAALLVFLVTGALLIPWGGITVATWLILTVLNALVATTAYLTVLRRDLTLVPLFCGVTGALGAVEHALARAYPGALASGLFATLLFIAVGWSLTRFLRTYASTRTAT